MWRRCPLKQWKDNLVTGVYGLQAIPVRSNSWVYKWFGDLGMPVLLNHCCKGKRNPLGALSIFPELFCVLSGVHFPFAMVDAPVWCDKPPQCQLTLRGTMTCHHCFLYLPQLPKSECQKETNVVFCKMQWACFQATLENWFWLWSNAPSVCVQEYL